MTRLSRATRRWSLQTNGRRVPTSRSATESRCSWGRRVATVERMTIQRMEHAGIVVDDLAAATAFFVELGLKLHGPERRVGCSAKNHQARSDERALLVHACGCNPDRMTEPAATTITDAQLGRKAAEHLAHCWPEMDGLTELASPEFAAAAVSVAFDVGRWGCKSQAELERTRPPARSRPRSPTLGFSSRRRDPRAVVSTAQRYRGAAAYPVRQRARDAMGGGLPRTLRRRSAGARSPSSNRRPVLAAVLVAWEQHRHLHDRQRPPFGSRAPGARPARRERPRRR
jgi:hypothetical protein